MLYFKQHKVATRVEREVNDLRKWLKKLREESGLSQQQVADRLNITRQYYQQIEAGDRQQKMDITLSSKLSELFGISTEEISIKERKIRQGEDTK